MFDLGHVLYIAISYSILILGLMICNKLITNQKYKDLILKVSAVLTVIIHYSTLYVDFFTTGEAVVDTTMILPLYPCNIAMWLLVIVAFMKRRDCSLYKHLSEMTFYLGIAGGIIGVLFNENYIANPNLKDWDVLNGLLSHTVMTFGCIYLLLGKYIEIRVSNVFSVFLMLMLLVVDGGVMIGLYRLFDLEPPNVMYLLENPFPQLPWFNTVAIGVLALIVVFIITVIYEQILLKESDRWYSRIKNRKEKNA